MVALIAKGMSNDDIAAELYLGMNTIKTYIRTAYRKMGVTSRTQAVLWALANGFDMQAKRVVLEANGFVDRSPRPDMTSSPSEARPTPPSSAPRTRSGSSSAGPSRWRRWSRTWSA